MKLNRIIILKTVSMVLAVESIAMIPSIIVGLYYKEQSTILGLALTSFITFIFAAVILNIYRGEKVKLKTREGFLVALLSWLFVCIIGAFPYIGSNMGYTFVDSIFESTAGWTTTGAFVIPINKMPHAILMWKATTNWMGGMGILIFTISLLPTLGKGAQNLAASENTGPELTKFAARLSDSSKISYIIYIGLTFIELICLLLDSKMGNFFAVINTLSTVSTAGIFDVGGEIAWGFTPYVRTVISVFSVIGAMNFSIFFLIVTGNFRRTFMNVEAKAYIMILSIASLLIFISLVIVDQYKILKSLGYAVSQSISFGSTSGFSVVDVANWPSFAQAILVILMLIGGCSASTAGSLKVIRVVIFFKLIMRGIYKRIHPNSIKPVMLNDKPVSPEIATSVTVYITLYIGLLAVGSLLLAIDNQDMITTLSAAIGALSNNGSGLGEISSGNFSVFSPFGKIVSSFLMLIGRTELYAAIIVLTRSFWLHDSSRI
ncbi:MAG: hypothetical protein MR269_05300 [Clostridiales bacterium]|nr:hypothetical protein [Clostridiales bacterium]